MARNGSPIGSRYSGNAAMTGFAPEWLRLREPADTSARNAGIAKAVAARFALRERVTVVDLGCGTGANLRATAPLLPNEQSWTLIDKDRDLLSAARQDLCTWADQSEQDGALLRLKKDHATMTVAFETIDLALDLERAFENPPALVTASAFFDLASEAFIRRLAKLCAGNQAAFYSVLTYNGVQRWTPHRPADNQIASAFHRHQLRDKGLGPAAGPLAPAHLADQFRMHGYLVQEGDSPWLLGRNDRMLIDELVRGYAMAAGEAGLVDAKTLETWVKVQRSSADIGHTDTFAVPA
jgi:SAM-dependent methyltransferase